MISLDDVRAAAGRIRPFVRRTPVLATKPLARPFPVAGSLFLKLESLQVTGSFKPRGAFNRVLTSAGRPKGIVATSGGNHGIAVAYVARMLGIKAHIVLAPGVAAEKIRAMQMEGAETEIVDPGQMDTMSRAMQIANEYGYLFSHPFADLSGIAGQGTCGLEILEDLPDIDVLVVAVGGGGLLGGIALAIKEQKPSVRIIGVEPTGANSLTLSLAAGAPVKLDRIETAAKTLAPSRSEQINIDLAAQYVDEMVNIADDAMGEGARWLWQEFGIGADLGGAAAAGALLQGAAKVRDAERVCCLVCGAGSAGVDVVNVPRG